MRRPTRPLLTLAVAALGLTLAGCGDTTDDEPIATGCSGPGGATATVEIPDFEFSPTPVRIDVCDAVVWENTHDQAHTSTGQGDASWTTGNLAAGARSEPVRFEEAGTFSYLCALHPFMEGTVEVG